MRRVREGKREREIPSAYQSVYLALHAPSLGEGAKGEKKQSTEFSGGRWDNAKEE